MLRFGVGLSPKGVVTVFSIINRFMFKRVSAADVPLDRRFVDSDLTSGTINGGRSEAAERSSVIVRPLI